MVVLFPAPMGPTTSTAEAVLSTRFLKQLPLIITFQRSKSTVESAIATGKIAERKTSCDVFVFVPQVICHSFRNNEKFEYLPWQMPATCWHLSKSHSTTVKGQRCGRESATRGLERLGWQCSGHKIVGWPYQFWMCLAAELLTTKFQGFQIAKTRTGQSNLEPSFQNITNYYHFILLIQPWYRKFPGITSYCCWLVMSHVAWRIAGSIPVRQIRGAAP